MEPPNERNSHMTENYEFNGNKIALSSSPLVINNYDIPNLKHQCELLKTANTSSEYAAKDVFMQDIANDVQLYVHNFDSRYRNERQFISDLTKIPLNDDTAANTYSLKSLNNDIQDLSFSDDLRSLNRDMSSVSNFNHCFQRANNSSTDVYNPDFSQEFSNSNFNSLQNTSTIFSSSDVPSNYILPENQSDELLFNGIELNDNEKLILTNEELTLLMQGKPGSCLELILNNGEILYAIIDSENGYNSSQSRTMQISKEELASNRQVTVPVEIEPAVVSGNQMQCGSPYSANNITVSSNFNSKTSTVSDFDSDSSNSYHSVIFSSLTKSINTSPINNENFNLCCNFPANDNDTSGHLMNSYSSIVPENHDTYSESSNVTYPCTSTISLSKEIPPVTSDSKNITSTEIKHVPTKMDYFPTANNSIFVSETGKKYPKKYSFYSNNFSSYLSQNQAFEKDYSEKQKSPQINNKENKPRNKTLNVVLSDKDKIEDFSPNSSDVNRDKLNTSENKNASTKVTSALISNNLIEATENFDYSNLKDNSCVEGSDVRKTSPVELETIKNKFLNSHSESVVNTICDRAVQSRARATLPSSYLSINRIKTNSTNKKPIYGVFAKKVIPGRTQFGPIEGVLIKDENEDTVSDNKNNSILQLTVESEKGIFLRLDVSNEDVSNWMRFVRPAKTYEEQNLIVSQQGSSLYFTTIEVIQPKQELLVWYSAVYSRCRNYKLLPGDPCLNGYCEKNKQNNNIAVRLESDKLLSENNSFNNNSNFNQKEDDTICNLDVNEENNECSSNIDLEIVQNTSSHCLPNESSDYNLQKSPIKDESRNKKPKSVLPPKKQNKLSKSLWLCTYCDLTFSNASIMNLHILIHAADNIEGTDTAISIELKNNENSELSCPQCNQKFPEKKFLISHVSQHGLKVQRWADESVNSKASDDFFQDDFEISEEKTYECWCRKKFKNPVALKNHKRCHSSESFLECPICEVTFAKLTALREHVYKHAENGIYACPHCPKKYDRYKYIRKHIRACHCKLSFTCKLCKKNFKSQYKLKSHMLKHSDEREFLCANCGKQFKRKDKLTEHMKNTHSEERERKSLEIMNSAFKKGKLPTRKSFKKKLPTKVLRMITENVNDYFYKCYICNIGFKRRGMLVNHLNSFHPGVSLDTIPELNVPILKAYCNFYCLYCDKFYKSNSKRKAHIIKSHPGAKIPSNLERGTVLNDPYSKHVGSVISNPFNCGFCYRQYASRAKLLNHHRKSHSDLLPADMKAPRTWNSQKRKKKNEGKHENSVVANGENSQATFSSVDNMQISNVEFDLESNSNLAVSVDTSNVISIQNNSKENVDINQQIISLTHLLSDELRSSLSQEQYLKILQSSNGITVTQTDENGEHTVSLENSSALLQQILTTYSFPSS